MRKISFFLALLYLVSTRYLYFGLEVVGARLQYVRFLRCFVLNPTNQPRLFCYPYLIGGPQGSLFFCYIYNFNSECSVLN